MSNADASADQADVLVVDDNEVNLLLARCQLERLGYGAETARNGREAVQRCACTTYALVLMDCQMPEVDGFAATREIRRLEAGTGAHIPIVAMTASATTHDREACSTAGMDDFITKPVSLESLREAIDRWLPRQARTSQPTTRASAEGAATPGAPPDCSRDPIDRREIGRARKELGDASLQQFVKVYLRELPARRRAIANAAGEGSRESLERAAHALRAPSAAVGAMRLAALASELERAAGSDRVGSLVAALDSECSAVSASLRPVSLEAPREEGG